MDNPSISFGNPSFIDCRMASAIEWVLRRKSSPLHMTNNSVPSENENQPGTLAWKKIVAKYQKPAVARSAWQIANTLVPYALPWVLAYLPLSVLVVDTAAGHS